MVNKCECCLNRYDNFGIGHYECLFYGLDIEMCLKDEQTAFRPNKLYHGGKYSIFNFRPYNKG